MSSDVNISSRFPIGMSPRALVHRVYTVGHFNRPTCISQNLSTIEKNGSDKSWRGQREPLNGANDFNLEVDYQGYFKVKVILWKIREK